MPKCSTDIELSSALAGYVDGCDSQRDAARRLGVNHSLVHHVLNSRGKVSEANRRKLNDALARTPSPSHRSQPPPKRVQLKQNRTEAASLGALAVEVARYIADAVERRDTDQRKGSDL